MVELINDYLEGALPAADARRFDAHLTECDACTTYLEQMRETVDALGHIPAGSLSPEACETLLRAFRDWHGSRQRAP